MTGAACRGAGDDCGMSTAALIGVPRPTCGDAGGHAIGGIPRPLPLPLPTPKDAGCGEDGGATV